MKDLVIIVSDVEKDSDGNSYAVTRVYRFDLVGKVEDLIEYLEAYQDIVEGSQMVNK